jgi:hypothetical protein
LPHVLRLPAQACLFAGRITFRRENPMKWVEAGQVRRRAAAACDLNQR